MLSSAGHMGPHPLYSSVSALQLAKPSPLSSADNAPRSLHLNPVQAVKNNNNNHYTTLYLYTHSPTPASGHKLRRMPAGANLAQYRLQQQQQQQQPPPPHHHHHHHHARSQSLTSIPPKTASTTTNNGSPPSANHVAAMSSINAIAAGPGPNNAPPGGPPPGRFDGPRSPPSEFARFFAPLAPNSTRVASPCWPTEVKASVAHLIRCDNAWLHHVLTSHITPLSPLSLPLNMLSNFAFSDNLPFCVILIGSC